MTITLPPELQIQLQTLADRRGEDLNTIDALAMRICEEHPEAAGVPANFTLLDELEGQVIQQEYLAQALAELPERFYQQVPYSLMEAVMNACLVDPARAI